MTRTSVPLKPYRIFLSVTPAESHRLEAAAKELREKSFEKENLLVAVSESLLDKYRGGTTLDGFTVVPIRGTDHHAAFLEICSQFSDRDFQFVKASTIVPEYWDLRLAWTATSRLGIATVSPCFDGGAPADLTDENRDSRFAIDAIDRICYESSTLANAEVHDFFHDCFYVCADALADILQQFPNLREQAMCEFSEGAHKLNYVHLLADHLCVSSTAEMQAFPYPAPIPHIKAFELLRNSASKHKADWQPPSLAGTLKPRHLHVMHTWGGGLEKWVTEYCRADKDHQNFVLKSIGDGTSFGQQVWLFREIDDPEPIQTWSLSPAIKGTAVEHSEYDSAFSDILDNYGIDRVLISSLIGHSLNVLRSTRRTVLICHDYYPFCPVLNITFENVCTTCNREKLAACTTSNPYNRFFHNLAPNELMEIREVFGERIRSAGIPMVAPTPSVAASYTQLVPEFGNSFRVIPHGARPIVSTPLNIRPSPPRFRIVIPGRLPRHKGLDLFKQVQEQLSTFAEILLVGCGIEGQGLKGRGVNVVPEYAWEEMPRIIEEFQPDVGLLLSVVPETFSYTLQELLEMGIPPVATRIGGFADRIENGISGFLCEPTATGVLTCLQNLAHDRTALENVRNHLYKSRFRTVAEMLEDYDVLLSSHSPSAAAYFSNDARNQLKDLKSTPQPQAAQPSFEDRLMALAEVDVRQLHRTIADRDKTLAILRQALADVETSKSWRLTEPARKAVSVARKAVSLPAHILRQLIPVRNVRGPQ